MSDTILRQVQDSLPSPEGEVSKYITALLRCIILRSTPRLFAPKYLCIPNSYERAKAMRWVRTHSRLKPLSTYNWDKEPHESGLHMRA